MPTKYLKLLGFLLSFQLLAQSSAPPLVWRSVKSELSEKGASFQVVGSYTRPGWSLKIQGVALTPQTSGDFSFRFTKDSPNPLTALKVLEVGPDGKTENLTVCISSVELAVSPCSDSQIRQAIEPSDPVVDTSEMLAPPATPSAKWSFTAALAPSFGAIRQTRLNESKQSALSLWATTSLLLPNHDWLLEGSAAVDSLAIATDAQDNFLRSLSVAAGPTWHWVVTEEKWLIRAGTKLAFFTSFTTPRSFGYRGLFAVEANFSFQCPVGEAGFFKFETRLAPLFIKGIGYSLSNAFWSLDFSYGRNQWWRFQSVELVTRINLLHFQDDSLFFESVFFSTGPRIRF